jgi:hypothetical protein
MVKVPVDRIGDGAAGDGPEQTGGDNRHLARSADSMPHGGERKIDEKALGAGGFQESAEKDKENHVCGQNIGHDAEHAVALVEDRGTHLRKRIAGMGEQIGHVGAVDTIQQQNDAHEDENDTHHTAGQFNADEHAENGHVLVKDRFRTGAVVDGLEIENPVAHREDGPGDEQVVDHAQDFVSGLVGQKDQDVGDDDVDAAMVLGGRRL